MLNKILALAIGSIPSTVFAGGGYNGDSGCDATGNMCLLFPVFFLIGITIGRHVLNNTYPEE